MNQPKLKVDMEKLELTKKKYDEVITSFEDTCTKLEAAVKALEGTDWKTAGSDAFFEIYDGSWKKDMKNNIAYLKHLRNCLRDAQGTYAEIYEDGKISSLF